jgi:hypothetical protein
MSVISSAKVSIAQFNALGVTTQMLTNLRRSNVRYSDRHVDTETDLVIQFESSSLGGRSIYMCIGSEMYLGYQWKGVVDQEEGLIFIAEIIRQHALLHDPIVKSSTQIYKTTANEHGLSFKNGNMERLVQLNGKPYLSINMGKMFCFADRPLPENINGWAVGVTDTMYALRKHFPVYLRDPAEHLMRVLGARAQKVYMVGPEQVTQHYRMSQNPIGCLHEVVTAVGDHSFTFSYRALSQVDPETNELRPQTAFFLEEIVGVL